MNSTKDAVLAERPNIETMAVFLHKKGVTTRYLKECLRECMDYIELLEGERIVNSVLRKSER